MEKPSVTIQHKEAYAVSGVLVVLVLFISFLNDATAEKGFLGLLIPVLCLLLAVFFLFLGRSSERMDEKGIYICTPFSTKQYHWDELSHVGILAPSGKDLAKIEIGLKKGKILQLDYTKRTLSCVCYYYGEPDWDKYGKPPSIF